MNIGMRLAPIVVLSIVLYYPAIAAYVCLDRKAAITAVELSQEASELELKYGESGKATQYEERAAQIAKSAKCVRVDNYPPERTNNPIKFGCRVFSGEARLSSGELKTVYWTRCPKPKE